MRTYGTLRLLDGGIKPNHLETFLALANESDRQGRQCAESRRRRVQEALHK